MSFTHFYFSFNYMKNTKKEGLRSPHPIDLKDLKKPLQHIGFKEDRSIPYLVRKAVKYWLENNYPDIKTEA